MHDGADVPAAKKRLRGELSAVRSARTASQLEQARAAIREVVLARCAASAWACVAAYVPLRTEPGSTELLAELAGGGVRVLVPITLGDRELDWVAWSPSGLGDRLGLAAIAAAQAVFVPALAVALDGTRLGRGGGSYDRALPRSAPGTPLAALLFDEELVAALPQESWDRPVTDVVTPAGWVHL